MLEEIPTFAQGRGPASEPSVVSWSASLSCKGHVYYAQSASLTMQC